MELETTVEQYSERLRKRISERDGIIKLVITLAVAMLSLFGANFVINVLGQLRYFQEQLAFWSDSLHGGVDPKVLEAIQIHTQEFHNFRQIIAYSTVVLLIAIIVISFVYYRLYSENYWSRRSNRLIGKENYYEIKRKQKKDRLNAKNKKRIKMLESVLSFLKSRENKKKS